MGSTRGMMSWLPSASGFVRASRLSRAFSLTSPVRRRYLVPLRPWARRARSSRRGVHHAHSSVQATSHSSATDATAPTSAHGEVSRSISRTLVTIGAVEEKQRKGRGMCRAMCVNVWLRRVLVGDGADRWPLTTDTCAWSLREQIHWGLKKPKNFQNFPSHPILRHIHRVLNIGENKN